jgi:hypothetical protein
MDKIRATGDVVAEDLALAIVDSVMSTAAINFLQISQRLLPDNNVLTVK